MVEEVFLRMEFMTKLRQPPKEWILWSLEELSPTHIMKR